ncbi:serine hydrolase domain-containing protein [Oceaniglobus trochenteri]|uniref:serine hydrolase domain-containing protein n=1 Tax=Oceaniglobus trochenteri TaxID=2763260 RepID=UPI001CFFAD44|nr:serine hydrolase [Oceaniglobus trochenteri]
MRCGLSRRTALALLGAGLALPAHAAPTTFDDAFTLARQVDQLHSLLIGLDGKVIEARAFRGPSLDTAVNVKSVSKTLLSCLAGAALERGEIPSLDTPVAPFLKRLIPRRADRRVRQITVEHLLAMQSGLAPFAGPTYGGWVSGKHWIFDALAAPMQADPGTTRLYSTANTHILGAVLANAAGKSLLDLANERIGAPLDIAFEGWTRDPQGNYLGGNDMRISPMGMFRFGEAYRTGGTWQDETLTTPAWIDTCWQPRTMADVPNHQYGLTWFLWDADGVRVNYARGYGGQMIYVVPERRLTVCITSNPGKPATVNGHLKTLHALLSGVILPVTRTAL